MFHLSMGSFSRYRVPHLQCDSFEDWSAGIRACDIGLSFGAPVCLPCFIGLVLWYACGDAGVIVVHCIHCQCSYIPSLYLSVVMFGVVCSQLEAVVRIAESIAKMALAPFATDVHVDEALRLFQVSTLDAALSGTLSGVEGFTPAADQQEVQRCEQQLKSRFPVGSQVLYSWKFLYTCYFHTCHGTHLVLHKKRGGGACNIFLYTVCGERRCCQ